MITAPVFTDIEAPPSCGAGDTHTFGVDEWVRVPQHQHPRQIVAVRTDTSEPFYAFDTGYGRKWWSETDLLKRNPSTVPQRALSPVLRDFGIDIAITPVIPVKTHPDAILGMFSELLNPFADVFDFAGHFDPHTVLADLFRIASFGEYVVELCAEAADTEPDTDALDDAAIAVTEALTYTPETAVEVVNRYAHVTGLCIPADLQPLTTIQVSGHDLAAGDVLHYWYGADVVKRPITRIANGCGFYDYERNGVIVENAFPIYDSVGLYPVCGGAKFEAARLEALTVPASERKLTWCNAAGEWVWGERVRV